MSVINNFTDQNNHINKFGKKSTSLLSKFSYMKTNVLLFFRNIQSFSERSCWFFYSN